MLAGGPSLSSIGCDKALLKGMDYLVIGEWLRYVDFCGMGGAGVDEQKIQVRTMQEPSHVGG